jgi:hypothetical protein
MRQYRVVRDAYLGYEVQCRRWWWPFWVQCDRGKSGANTNLTLCDANQFIQQLKLDKVVAVYPWSR